MLLGFILFYSGIHAVLIIYQKTQNTTAYENVVLIFAAVWVILMFIALL